MPDEIKPSENNVPADDEQIDESEVVPHSGDDDEQTPWCVGFFA